MTEAPDEGHDGAARPDREATLNEAGLEVFAVDGTDSFAVPGPADGLGPEAEPPPAISRTRVLVTAGAIVAGLVFVVAVGAGSPSDATLRADGAADGAESADAVPFWGGGDPRWGAVDLSPRDDETLRRMGEGTGVVAPADPDAADDRVDPAADPFDETAGRTDSTDPSEWSDWTDDPYGDGGTVELDDRYRGLDHRPFTTIGRRTTLPRRIPVITTPRATTPWATATTTTTTTTGATTTTTLAATTTTTTAPTTTSRPTTTTVRPTTSLGPTTTLRPTTTTPAPAPAPVPVGPWVDASTGLTSPCPTTVRVWARPGGAVVVADGVLHALVAGVWTPIASPPGGSVSTFAAGPDDRTFWVGTPTGVFATTDGGARYLPIGDPVAAPMDVRSLSVAPNGTTMLAVTGTGLVRRDLTSASWTPVTTPGALTLGEVLLVDDTRAVVGTSGGVLRSIGSTAAPVGTSWDLVSSTPVVGAPVRDAGPLSWMATAGAVLRGSDDLGTWTDVTPAGAVAPGARALVAFGAELVTSGATPNQLVVLAPGGDGAPWTARPYGPLDRATPDALVRSGTTTYALSAGCPDGAPAIRRLPDTP